MAVKRQLSGMKLPVRNLVQKMVLLSIAFLLVMFIIFEVWSINHENMTSSLDVVTVQKKQTQRAQIAPRQMIKNASYLLMAQFTNRVWHYNWPPSPLQKKSTPKNDSK